jgi:hypothetical protein
VAKADLKVRTTFCEADLKVHTTFCEADLKVRTTRSRSAGLQACPESPASSPGPSAIISVRDAVDRDMTWANRLTVPAK